MELVLKQKEMQNLIREHPNEKTRLPLGNADSRVMGYWVKPENQKGLMANPVDLYAVAKALLPLLDDHETLRRVLSGEIKSDDDFPGF
jgi:hypothetical protein